MQKWMQLDLPILFCELITVNLPVYPYKIMREYIMIIGWTSSMKETIDKWYWEEEGEYKGVIMRGVRSQQGSENKRGKDDIRE